MNMSSIDITTAKDMLGNYAIRTVCVIGLLFNFYTLKALLDERLKLKFYNFQRCRCFCSVCICLLGIFYPSYPLEALIPLRMGFLASAISDILLILNRVVLMYDQKKSIFYALSKKANLALCFSVPIGLFSPAYFAFQSKEAVERERYVFIVFLIETLLSIVALLVLNIIAVIGLGTLKRRVTPIVTSDISYRHSRVQATLLTIILTLICVLTRGFNCTVAFYYTAFIESTSSDRDISLLFSAGSFCLLFVAHALDGLLFYCYDRKLRAAFSKMLAFECQ